MFKLIPGKNPECTNFEYHGEKDHISSSGIKLMFKNSREYYNTYILGDRSNSPSGPNIDFGSYMHSLILEPHKTDEEFAIFDGHSRRGGEWETFLANNINKTILLKAYKQKADELLKNFHEMTVFIDHPERGTEEVRVDSFFEGGESESTYTTELEDVKVKVRLDYHKLWDTFGSINDVKTTSEESVATDNLVKICARLSYDISAALYVDVLEKVTGVPHNFFFLFMSTTSYKIAIVKASKQMLANGRRKYKEGLRKLKEARKTGKYFKNEIEEIHSPGYDVWFPMEEVKDDN